MVNRLTAILIESSYLLVAGMEQLLSELPEINLKKVFDGNEKKLGDKICNQKPDIIFINPSSLNLQPLGLISELQQKSSFILIGLTSDQTAQNIKSRFSGNLNITEGKFELLEELKIILGKRWSPEKEKKNNSVISDREKMIIKEVVSGLTNQEIANKLFLSIHTVTTHRKNITNKLGIKTVSGLTVYALMNKIVDIHEIEHK